MSLRLNGIWPSLVRLATPPSFGSSTRRTTLSQSARRTYASSTSHNVPSESPNKQEPTTFTLQKQEREQLPAVVVKTRTGRDAEVHFNPIPGTDLAKLRASLQSLVSFPSSLGRERNPTFGSPSWIVSRQHNALYRKIAIASDDVLGTILSHIKEIADEMDHHPSIVEIGKKCIVQIGKMSVTSPSHICIVCTTHKPPGLSLRDARLAAKINTILEPHDIYHRAPGRKDRERRAFLQGLRKTTRQEVEASIQKAT